MKTFTAIAGVAILAWLVSGFTPWWGVAVAAAGVGLLVPLKGRIAFLAGFAGVAIFWGILAFRAGSFGDGVLASRMAELFSLKDATILTLVTCLVGALVGGMAALSGNILHRIIRPPEEVNH